MAWSDVERVRLQGNTGTYDPAFRRLRKAVRPGLILSQAAKKKPRLREKPGLPFIGDVTWPHDPGNTIIALPRGHSRAPADTDGEIIPGFDLESWLVWGFSASL
jgi:hypothetical protein